MPVCGIAAMSSLIILIRLYRGDKLGLGFDSGVPHYSKTALLSTLFAGCQLSHAWHQLVVMTHTGDSRVSQQPTIYGYL